MIKKGLKHLNHQSKHKFKVRFPYKRLTLFLWVLSVAGIFLLGLVSLSLNGYVQLGRSSGIGSKAEVKINIPLVEERKADAEVRLGLTSPTTTTTTTTLTYVNRDMIYLGDSTTTTTTLKHRHVGIYNEGTDGVRYKLNEKSDWGYCGG